MNITELKPEKVFKFFKEISEIPRGSGNTEAIADYCMRFASERGLRAALDNGGNVIIYKNATDGYEACAPVILQGHLDMVCEVAPEFDIDMTKSGLNLKTDGEYLWAEGTTLGADDGIAVAFILAILDSSDISHPPIEALFTRDEEVGMLGAAELDASNLKGRRLINIDSEDEGILTVSCAGGAEAELTLGLELQKADKDFFALKLEIGGLLSGHSGVEINKNRVNAAQLCGRILDMLMCEFELGVSDLSAGGKTNVIPGFAECTICVKNREKEEVKNKLDEYAARLKIEFAAAEPNLSITVSDVEMPCMAIFGKTLRNALFLLHNAPNGVQRMDPNIDGMVLSSLNLGDASIDNDRLVLKYLIRGGDEYSISEIFERLDSFAAMLNAKVEYDSGYPAWEYRADSPLRDVMIEVFEDMYGKKPLVTGIHAGLECGLLSGKLENSDMVSFGPSIDDIHTPNEKLNIASAKRCFDYLIRVLEKLK